MSSLRSSVATVRRAVRAMADSAGREDVTRVLAEHWGRGTDIGTPRAFTEYGGWNQECACGFPLGDAGGEDGEERVEAAHRAHLADVLASLSDERLAQAEAKALKDAADDLREWRQANATNYHTSQGLLALERKWRGACCPTCGVVGSHGLIHVRHGNGGGHNKPCPRTDGDTR
jgi:hypothetical protein